MRKEIKPQMVENEYLREKAQILKTLDELDELYVTNLIQRNLHCRLRHEYIKRLSEIEIGGLPHPSI